MAAAFVMLAAGAHGAVINRIVSTSPHITETLFAMGLGPRVVGVTIYCAYPKEVLKLPKIGTLLEPDVEAIMALRPDLVIVAEEHQALASQLTHLHIASLKMEGRNLDTIFSGARALGVLTGTTDATERWIGGLRAQLASAATLTAGKPRPTVAFIVGHTPGKLEGLIAGAGGSYFSDLLRYAGGVNAFADAPVAYPKISLEEILSRNPDVILELSDDTRPTPADVMKMWGVQKSLQAVRNGRVHMLESGPFLVPGPRAGDAARILAHLLHPEAQR